MHIIPSISNAEYHARPEISKSQLDLIRRSPALFRHRLTHPQERTPAMRWGTLVHTAVLEPDQLPLTTVIAPTVDRRTKDGKAAWEAFQLQAAGREVITAEESIELIDIASAIERHESAGRALAMVDKVETSIIWTDEDTGMACRCRPDAILSNGLIVDLKTTQDASPEGFAKSIANFRYHVQAAYYSDGYTAAFGEAPKGFMFIAVEKTAPYLVACYLLSDLAVIRGRAEYKEDLQTLKQCLATDVWPGYSQKPLVIDLPKWA
jgi:exodeoxyribonuclease VIII